MEWHVLWYILAGALIFLGLAGTILPALPGLPLMFAGMLLAAWVDGFTRIGAWTIAVLALLMLLSLAADLMASVLGAKRAGASRLALVGAALGTVIGFFFGIPGILLGPFLGAVLGELIGGKHWKDASRIGLATWIGLLVGAAVKATIAFAMLGIFALALVL